MKSLGHVNGRKDKPSNVLHEFSVYFCAVVRCVPRKAMCKSARDKEETKYPLWGQV